MATYYLDSVAGNDSNTSVQAQNISTPWRTISKINSFWSSLNAGDVISLKRGSVFKENLIVTKSGSLGSPITINSYGTGNKPIISGLSDITTWVPHPSVSGVYQSPVISSVPTGYYMYLVSFQGQIQEMGRYPNSGLFLNYENTTGVVESNFFGSTETLTDNQLPNSPSWSGAEIVIRRNIFVWSRSYVTQHNSGGNIVHFEPTNILATNGWGYFFQNDIKCLDTVGDWYYDTNNKVLNVYFGSLSPSSFSVRAATVKELITINGYSYINIDNIYFEGANERGIRPYNNAHNINITNCVFDMMGIEGVCDGPEYSQPSAQDVLIDGCTFDQCQSNGVKFTECSGVTITNNQFTNIGLFPGASREIWGDYNGILIRGCSNSTGTNNLIQYNSFQNMGYCGVFGYGSYITIKNNFADNYCLTKSDAGGIYWYYSNTMVNRLIDANICINGYGTPQATNSTTPGGAVGIYLDDNSSNMTVQNNICSNNSRNGIYFHNSTNINAYNNISFNNGYQLSLESDSAGDTVRNIIATGNVLVNKSDDQFGLYMGTDLGSGDIPPFINTLNNNYYIDAFRRAGMQYININGSEHYFEVQSLNTEYTWEASQLISPVNIAPITSLSVVGSNKASPTSGSSSGDTSIDIGNVLSNTWYRVIVDISSSSNQRSVRLSILRNGGAFDRIANYTFIKCRTTNTTQTVYFKANVSAPAVIIFRGSSGITYNLSNINVVQLSGSEVDRNDYFKLVYNNTKFSNSYSLPGTYIDHLSSAHAGSITLSPYTGAILFKTSSNLAPIITMGGTQTITLPTSIASLSGTATDTDGTISSYLWTKDSGAAGESITSPSSPSTTVSSLVAGTYIFRLTVIDNLGASSFGTQTVVVNNASLAQTGNLKGKKRL